MKFKIAMEVAMEITIPYAGLYVKLKQPPRPIAEISVRLGRGYLLEKCPSVRGLDRASWKMNVCSIRK